MLQTKLLLPSKKATPSSPTVLTNVTHSLQGLFKATTEAANKKTSKNLILQHMFKINKTLSSKQTQQE
jgi:hypothetical protein